MAWVDKALNQQKSIHTCKECGWEFDREIVSGLNPTGDDQDHTCVVELGPWTIEDFHRKGVWTCPFCGGSLIYSFLGEVTQVPVDAVVVWDHICILGDGNKRSIMKVLK
jgi:rubredoxin